MVEGNRVWPTDRRMHPPEVSRPAASPRASRTRSAGLARQRALPTFGRPKAIRARPSVVARSTGVSSAAGSSRAARRGRHQPLGARQSRTRGFQLESFTQRVKDVIPDARMRGTSDTRMVTAVLSCLTVLGIASHRPRLAWLMIFVVLGAAFLAAVLTGPRPGGLSLAVEVLAADAADLLERLGLALPLGYAFGAGMLAAVNPCGVALLPAYVGLYLRPKPTSRPASLAGSTARLVGGSLVISTTFVLIFGGVGLVISTLAGALVRYLPWLGLLAGVLLLVAGGRALVGLPLWTSFPDRAASRLAGRLQSGGCSAYAAFGLVYALSSLGCTLPIFLSVVGNALVADGPARGAAQFALFGWGMGLVLAGIASVAAIGRRALLRPVRCLGPHWERATSGLLVLTGAYVVYYWLTVGGLLPL